jgi:spore germination protein KC
MMKTLSKVLSALLSVVMLISLSGCWNYSEIDDMNIVAGVAIDKNKKENNLQLTVEMVDTQEGMQQSQASFKMISLSGNTIFDIARNMISLTGKKLLWSHAKVIILSEEVAREGLIKVIDWYSRDTETRADVFLFVSSEKNAQEVLNLNSETKTIISYELAQMMNDETFTSTAPVVQIWDFIDKLESSGDNAIAPLIYMYEKNGQKNEHVNGTAVFVRDRMVGKLNGDETKYALFAKNKIKGGVLEVENAKGTPTYSLEILSSRTKVKPKWVDGRLEMQIHTVTHTGLDEAMSAEGFAGEETIQAIAERAGESLQQNILSVIRKMQREYHADIFGFGEIVHEEMPKTWRKLKDKWPEEFTGLDVKVRSEIIIQSTAKSSRTIKLGD